MPPTPSSEPTARRARWRVILAWLFPIALLAFSTFYFFGAIGHFNDDYFYLQRDLQTGEIRSLILDRPFHVWRPLFQVVVPALHTLLWDHVWAFHLLNTLLHGLNCWLLFRLCIRLGVSHRIAACASLLFMVYPAHFEAVFWLCCVPTLLGTALLLACFHAQLSWLERPAGETRGMTRLYPLGLAVAAFSIAALNEQPAGPLAILPLLFLLRPPSAGCSIQTHARRSIVPPLCAGVALIIYLIGHFRVLHSRPGFEDREPLRNRIAENTIEVARDIPGELLLRDFAAGAWSHGRQVLEQHTTLTLFSVAFLLLGALLAAAAWFNDPRTSASASNIDPRPLAPLRPFALILFGAAWIICAWIPIVVSHSVTMPRLHYVPTIGLLFIGAAVVQLIAAAAVRAGVPTLVLRLAGAITLVAAVVPFTVMMVGVQDGYRLRSQRDLSEAGQLAALFGDVPPGTLFVPMRVESRVLDTGSWKFDLYFMSSWNWAYAAGWNFQQVFRRTDVHVAQAAFCEWMGVWAPPGDGDIRTNAILVGTIARPLPTPNFTRNPEGAGRLIPWNRLVPFTIDRDGVVKVYTRVYYTPTKDAPPALDFAPELVEKARIAHKLPERRMILRPFPDDLRRKARTDDREGKTGVVDPGPVRRRQQPKGAPQPE